MTPIQITDLRKVCPRCGGSGNVETSVSEDGRYSFQDQCFDCSSWGVVPISESELLPLFTDEALIGELVKRGVLVEGDFRVSMIPGVVYEKVTLVRMLGEPVGSVGETP